MKRVILTALAAIAGLTAQAQYNLTTLSYTQDFNTLDTGATASSNLPSGWKIAERGNAAADSTYVGGNAGAGNGNGGNSYSAGSVGSSERALGSLGSGNNRSRFGVAFTNNTGAPIYSITLTGKVEQWRLGDTTWTAQDTTLFDYSTTATGLADTLASWLSFPSLELRSPVVNNSPTGGLDGNLPANQSTINGTFNVTIPVGATIWLRWFDVNIVGSDDLLALDDVSITFGTVPSVKPNLTYTNPPDNSTNVAFGTSTLYVVFDKAITLGSGNVLVNNLTASTTQTVAASACTVNGDTVFIPNVTLAAATQYAVQFDSTLATFNSNNCLGIYNNTSWNFSTLNPYPSAINFLPSDNAANVVINTAIRMRFNKPVGAGSGNFTLKNITAGTQQVFAVPSAAVTISNDTVTITAGTLAYSTLYAIQIDSTCFNNNGYKYAGIYTDTNWNFTTEAAPPPPVTSLNDAFTGCVSPNLGTFKEYSAQGGQRWQCTTFGHNDSAAVRINGASPNATFDNQDWLLSPNINVSAMGSPYFHFWNKVRFTGNETKEILYSTNYVSGDPTLSTWTPLNIATSSTDTVWTFYGNKNLTSIKNTPFHIAFKYTSVAAATASAQEWSIDDVSITDGPLAVRNSELMNAKVAISATIAGIALNINIAAAQKMQLRIVDMSGAAVYAEAINVNEGANMHYVNLPSIAQGVYTAILSSSNGAQVALRFAK